MKVNNILFGAAYYEEYLPYDRISQDFEMMKAAGMNTIRIAESTWSTLEPQDHIFDFSHIDRMLDAAEKYKMNVIIGTPTYAVPTWLVRLDPTILATTHTGKNLYGPRQNMDITNQTYLRYAKRVIETLISHVAQHPCVIGYQIDNETKPYDTCSSNVQHKFVEWLKERYPDLQQFNQLFGLDYWSNRINSWEDFPDIRGTINGSLAAEFSTFQRKLVTDFFYWQADLITKYKRKDQFITHNFDFSWKSFSYGLQPEVNQYDCAKCMTVAGGDIYHPSQSELTGAEINFCGSILRGLKKDNYLILETQAQGNTEWLPYPGQLRLHAYSHLATGANSVLYWHWHSIHNAIESYWKGVLSHDFSANATYQEATVLGKEFQLYGNQLKNLQKSNSVAILLDHASLTGLQEFPIRSLSKDTYNTIVRFLADALYRLNIEFDILYSEDIADTPSVLDEYQLVCIPAMYSISDTLIHTLDSYTKNGGHLLVTCRSLFSNEQLKIYPDVQPHGMCECLGLHYDQFTYPVNVQLDYKNATVSHWMELLIPDTAQTLASYIHPAWGSYAAVTKNHYHNGIAWYLGCMFDDSALDNLLCDILSDCDIKIPRLRFPIIQKTGVNDAGKTVTYLLNYSDSSKDFSMPTDGISLFSGTSYLKNDHRVLAAWDVDIILSN